VERRALLRERQGRGRGSSEQTDERASVRVNRASPTQLVGIYFIRRWNLSPTVTLDQPPGASPWQPPVPLLPAPIDTCTITRRVPHISREAGAWFIGEMED